MMLLMTILFLMNLNLTSILCTSNIQRNIWPLKIVQKEQTKKKNCLLICIIDINRKSDTENYFYYVK